MENGFSLCFATTVSREGHGGRYVLSAQTRLGANALGPPSFLDPMDVRPLLFEG